MNAEIATGRRKPADVMKGTETVTPRRPLAIRYDGTAERLVPGRDRLSPGHPLVIREPGAFIATDRKDEKTRLLLECMVLERALKNGTPVPRCSSRPSKSNWSLEPQTATSSSWAL
jgi:hypothetical protein